MGVARPFRPSSSSLARCWPLEGRGATGVKTRLVFPPFVASYFTHVTTLFHLCVITYPTVRFETECNAGIHIFNLIVISVQLPDGADTIARCLFETSCSSPLQYLDFFSKNVLSLPLLFVLPFSLVLVTLSCYFMSYTTQYYIILSYIVLSR